MRNDYHFPVIAKVFTPLILIGGCVGICCACILFYWAVVDEGRPIVLADTTSDFDASSLPEEPTLNDWYALAGQVLESYDRQFKPDLKSIYYALLPCSSEVSPNVVEIVFGSFFYDRTPNVKTAQISFDRSANEVSIYIYYEQLEFDVSKIDISKVQVDSNEALETADHFAGQNFRDSIDDNCTMAIQLDSDYMWKVRYHKNGQQWEDWEIWVDAIDGEVERRQVPYIK